MEDVIVLDSLTKKFGKLKAVDDISLNIPKGTVYALLGPNGAGKTTIIRMLTTILKPTSGTAMVAGYDIRKQPAKIRKKIGLAGQYAAVDEDLTGRENLIMIGRLHGLPAKDAKKRADRSLKRMELEKDSGRRVKTYSGGMRKRLDLGASFMNDPAVLFLDEPTEGLDVRARTDLWKQIREIVDRGTTVLLTTHYLEEAERLADRVALLNEGRLVAEGDISELKNKVGRKRLYIRIHDRDERKKAAGILDGNIDEEEQEVVVVPEDVSRFGVLIEKLTDEGIDPAEVSLRPPSLDEAFMELTG